MYPPGVNLGVYLECCSGASFEKRARALASAGAAREHVAPQAPGGAQLLALYKAVNPLAAAEVELPLDTARAGL